MKKTLTLLTILLLAQNINSQQSEFVVEHCVDKSTFQSPNGLICSNELKTRWFVMIPTYLDKTINPIANGFSIMKFNIGKFSYNDKLIIRFSDDTSLVLTSDNDDDTTKSKINDANNGTTRFTATVLNIYLLKNKPINSIKYVNGNDGVSFMNHLKGDDKSYFINAFTNFVVKNVKCVGNK
jgi:hypothetical protein